ncbi:hypothetical protein FSARC_1519 [Fusarium sarcochroum]|uniref:DUF7598 domain-containing protein n=1 Tax=Fusarium sarcochroum TaxID=1208366 RepID=A0A8H4XES2_9HYPO|nr:hypothetical protein FSARC_1519 [Fusarium sarcochroum]
MFGERIRGPGMIILQVLRVITITSLLAAAAGCWILIIKIDTSSGWFFFDALSLTFMSSAAAFFIVSELPFCGNYFMENWPVFSEVHGLTWLGLGLLLIGSNILGRLHQPYNAPDKLGLPFWRLIVASGILTITSGVLNITCSLIFRDGANNINARMVRADGSLARSMDEESLGKPQSNYTASFNEEKPKKTFMSLFWKKKGETASQAPRPHISQPITHDHDIERNAMPHYDHDPAVYDNDSDLDRRSPIVPEVRRPDTALHPMNMNARRSSLYSTANMSHF